MSSLSWIRRSAS